MNKRTYHTIQLYLAAFVTGCFFLLGCENSKEEIKKWTERVIMKEEAINVNSQLSQEGKIRATLKAPLMYRVSADTLYVEFPNTMHCDFYNPEGKVESWLDCKYGKYFESLNKVYLRDSVVVISVKGDTLKTPDLWWDQNTRLFYTDKPSTYHTPERKIYAQNGIRASQDFTDVRFNEVSGNIKMKEGTLPQ